MYGTYRLKICQTLILWGFYTPSQPAWMMNSYGKCIYKYSMVGHAWMGLRLPRVGMIWRRQTRGPSPIFWSVRNLWRRTFPKNVYVVLRGTNFCKRKMMFGLNLGKTSHPGCNRHKWEFIRIPDPKNGIILVVTMASWWGGGSSKVATWVDLDTSQTFGDPELLPTMVDLKRKFHPFLAAPTFSDIPMWQELLIAF